MSNRETERVAGCRRWKPKEMVGGEDGIPLQHFSLQIQLSCCSPLSARNVYLKYMKLLMEVKIMGHMITKP